VTTSIETADTILHEPDSKLIHVNAIGSPVTLTGEASYQFRSDPAYNDVAGVLGVIGITYEIRAVNP
jgi:hypothetical protein